MQFDWEDAFINGAYIAGGDAYPDAWAEAAAEFRKTCDTLQADISYGPKPRNTYDFVTPDGPAKGTFVFVHGGYWRMLDKSYWTHIAQGMLAHGWAVALPQYTLAPEARISEITAEIGQAITAIAATHAGPIRLAGHSAGGHLVSRMNCADTPLASDVTSRIENVVSISGVHHLEPLRMTSMNKDFQLTEAEAKAESPALLDPRPNARTRFWVGAAERPEFLRQTRMIAETWARKGADVADIYSPGEDHFSVVDPLTVPHSPLVQEILS